VPTYIYKLKSDSGKTLHGVMDAENIKDLKYKLHTSLYYFVWARRCNREDIFQKKIKDEELLMFTHRLSSLIGAGIPILSATNMLWRQANDPNLQMVISHLHRQLEEGNRIAQAMQDFPRVFPTMYHALIGIAEKSGRLVVILQRLSDYLHYQKQLVIRIKKATIYPLVVVIFALIVLLVMFTFVIPIFQQVMDRLNVPLPMLTKVILSISHWMKNGYVLGGIVLVLGLGVALYQQLKKNVRIAEYMDAQKLRLPILGNIFFLMALSRFVHSLSILLNAGVPIVESFEAAKNTAVNRYIIKGVNEVCGRVKQGGSLQNSFREAGIFPELLVDMVGVGESGGTVANAFENLAQHFDEEMDYKLNRVVLLLEPLLIILVGCIVIVTLVAVYLPILSIWKTLSA